MRLTFYKATTVILLEQLLACFPKPQAHSGLVCDHDTEEGGRDAWFQDFAFLVSLGFKIENNQ